MEKETRFPKITTHVLQEMKLKKEKIAMLTAYDFSMARILDQAGVEFIGPNSPGVLITDPESDALDKFKIGNIPAFLFRLPGGMSVVGRSGTEIFDLVDAAADLLAEFIRTLGTDHDFTP